jgi:hypothetical protein
LGGYNDAVDYVYQEVTVPSDTTEATLDFWYRVSGDDSDPDESLCIEILDNGLDVITGGCLPLYEESQDQWLNLSLDITGAELTSMLGQTVFVAFSVSTNATNPSTAWVDDVSFNVTGPGSLRITLAWTDYPGEPAAAPALVNDLDLEVIAPDDTHYYGNQGLYAGGDPCLRGGQWDACNNVEGVIIPGAADGTYTVIVHGYDVPQGGSQPFALVASGDGLQDPEPGPGATTVYLPLVVNNYDPSELLQNGDFDTGDWTPWQTDGSPALNDQVYRSASYSARLAGRNNVDSDYIYQEVTVPATATEVTLDFWYRVSSTDPSPADYMCIEIRNSVSGDVIVSAGCPELSLEPQGQWVNFQQSFTGTGLTPLLGQTVWVSFQGWTDAANPSTVWLDDVSFKVTP